jgi:hypothetical protein
MRVLALLLLCGVILANHAWAGEAGLDKNSSSTEGVVRSPYDSRTKGALQVKGETGDWFFIKQKGKDVGPTVPPKMNAVVELPPGNYDVFVNKTRRAVTIQVGKKVALTTGTLVVEGKGSFYTPYEGNEPRVAKVQPAMGAPIALFPGTYSVVVRVGTRNERLTDNAKITAGQKTVLRR